METIAEKLERARQTYADAVAALNEARADFEVGAGKDFSGIIKERDDLIAKIKLSELTVQVAEKHFQDTFRAAGYERTDEVNLALRAKVIESEILEELRAGLSALEKPTFDQEVAAVRAATKYRSMYLEAYKAWVRVQAYEHLSVHGEALGRILALAKHIGTVPVSGPNGFKYYDTNVLERLSDDVDAMRQAFVLDAIKEFAASHPESDTPTMPVEIGALDLGPFNSRELLTPGEMQRKRLELESQNPAD